MTTNLDTQWIELKLIDVPDYGRVHSPEAIATLANDMTLNGQLQNAVVAKGEHGRFELVIGKGRYEAAKSLGWERIRADVKSGLSEVQKLTIVAAENEAREDACPFYTAMLYSDIMKAGALTQEELAKQIGRDPSYVSLYMTLAAVPKEIWVDHQAQLTSLRLCLEIAKSKDAAHQKELVKAASQDGLGTAAVKKLAQKLKGHVPPTAEEPTEKAPFQITRKGKMIAIRALPPDPVLLDTYLQKFRIAVVEYLAAEEKAREKPPAPLSKAA